MATLFFILITCGGGYIGYIVGVNVPEPSFGITVFSIIFAVIASAGVAASFLDNISCKNNTPFLRKIAPLAFLCWLTRNKN